MLLAGLKRRFIRGETGSAGSGLGLAIVETIMTQTGGKLELLLAGTRALDDGFEARLTLNASRSTGQQRCTDQGRYSAPASGSGPLQPRSSASIAHKAHSSLTFHGPPCVYTRTRQGFRAAPL